MEIFYPARVNTSKIYYGSSNQELIMLKNIILNMPSGSNISVYWHSWNDEYFDESLFLTHQIQLPTTIKSAAKKRIIEFFYGRFCAKMAAKHLIPDINISVGINTDRSPQWPSEIVGSISHSQQIALSACGLSTNIAGIGIDIEHLINKAAAKDVFELIAEPNELQIKTMQQWPFEERLTLIFSAKESLYKALYPLVGVFFGFDCASLIAVDTSNNHFTLKLLKDIDNRWRKGTEIDGIYIRNHPNEINENYFITLIIIDKKVLGD